LRRRYEIRFCFFSRNFADIDNDCDGVVDNGCDGGGCTQIFPASCPAITAVTDDFNTAADGPLPGCWFSPPTSPVFVQAQQACAHQQGIAFQHVAQASSVTVTFDFTASTADGYEAGAILTSIDCTGTPEFILIAGVAGPQPHNLEVKFLSSGTVLQGTNFHELDGTYTITATLHTNGDVQLSLQGEGISESLNGNVGRTLEWTAVGTLAGRDPNGLTCFDNFELSSS